MFDKNKPYNDLPLLPPIEVVENLTILKKAIKANRALAKLIGSSRQLPNQNMLIHSMLLQEAKLSSEIENIVTTNDELYQAFSADKIPSDPNIKEVLHYQNALWEGYRLIKKRGFISTNLFIDIFKIVKETQAGIRNSTGTKIMGNKSKQVIYTPPEGENIIREKLKNLEDFINNDNDIDPLIKMAIMHYQFEAIHPFSDGNGRTGRILNILFLVNEELLELPILYLSKFIIENKSGYYRGLKQVTEAKGWEEWILYMLDAVEQTALFTQKKIDSIMDLIKETGEKIQNELHDIYSKDLIEIIFSQPYCKRIFLEKAGLVKIKTAGVYLSKLEKAGFLESKIVGKEKLYINRVLFNALKN